MNRDKVNRERRRFLLSATAVAGAVGMAVVAVPFIGSMNPSARVAAAGAPVDVDIAKIEPGALITVLWRGRPVWILFRTPAQLDALQSPNLRAQLRDPDSLAPQQFGSDVVNWHRSLDPRYLVVVAICTHLGCVPAYRPDMAPADLGPQWPGGFYCPCHGSRYDLSGRVYKFMPAPLNLPVPPHYYASGSLLRVGELPDKTAQNWSPRVW